MKAAPSMIGRFFSKANADNLTGLSAMVAYNLLLSIFPLALVSLFIAGRVLESEELAQAAVDELREIFPGAAEGTIVDTLRRLRESSTTTGIGAVIASLYLGSSFWGSLDTAFCRIYRAPCRTWLRQKLFSLGMLFVVLLFIASTVIVPAVQAVLLEGAQDLPFGLAELDGFVYALTLGAGLSVLFLALCVIYWRVPKGPIPWRCVWPGAVGVTVAITVLNWGFPLYLSNVSTLRPGTTLVFVLIILFWFYALAMLLLLGAVLNSLRLEGMPATQARRRAEADPEELALADPAPQQGGGPIPASSRP